MPGGIYLGDDLWPDISSVELRKWFRYCLAYCYLSS